MASVELRDITKSFGNVLALKDVSLSVSDREIFCLLAPPGSGKTTLLRIIAGLEVPERGEVLIDGKKVNDVPPQERDVAMVFEDVALYPHLTGFDNIAYSLKLRKLARGEIVKRVNEVAKLLRIDHLLNRRPGTYSGGERRRVAIARALVRRPKLLLLDQPFSDLDALVRHEMVIELKKLQSTVGQTMILATHDFEEAMVADRIGVMFEGTIHQVDTPQELYVNPRTVSTAQFVGSPAMNIFDCLLESTSGGKVIKHRAFNLHVPSYLTHELAERSHVLLGIRPEAIMQDPQGSIRAKVEVIQILGEEAIVDLQMRDGTRFKWVTTVQTLRSIARGTEVTLCFPLDKVYLFDPKTGVRISVKEGEIK